MNMQYTRLLPEQYSREDLSSFGYKQTFNAESVDATQHNQSPGLPRVYVYTTALI